MLFERLHRGRTPSGRVARLEPLEDRLTLDAAPGANACDDATQLVAQPYTVEPTPIDLAEALASMEQEAPANLSSSNQPSITVESEQLLDGAALVLRIEVAGCQALSQWSIDWGDDTTTDLAELGDTYTVAHYYAERDEDARYYVSAIAVDASGHVCEEIYELAVADVPAYSTLASFVADEFYDAEKGSASQSRICWAAGMSNVLYYTGWASGDALTDQGGSTFSFNSEDDVFEYVSTNFDNVGSSTLYGYEWFITGNYQATGVVGWAQPEEGSGGFYTSVANYNSLVSYKSYDGTDACETILPDIASKLENGWGSTVSLAFYSNNPGSTVMLAHTVTIWGFEYDRSVDPSSPEYYTAIYISDSDDATFSGRNDPDSLKKVHIEWSDTYNMYKLTDYQSGECWLAEFIALAPKSSALSETA